MLEASVNIQAENVKGALEETLAEIQADAMLRHSEELKRRSEKAKERLEIIESFVKIAEAIALPETTAWLSVRGLSSGFAGQYKVARRADLQSRHFARIQPRPEGIGAVAC
jgi:hypothetical protein